MGSSLTPSNKLLFARICYRAAGADDGVCRDTNPELSEALNMSTNSIKDLISALADCRFIKSNPNREKGYKREIIPRSDYLQPYLESNDEWRKKHGVRNRKPKPTKTPEPAPPYGENHPSPPMVFYTRG